MYNKIATLLLNSAQKNNTINEIYISQPDSDKEKLGGKLFILLEVEGKKNQSLKFISFLINKLEENYYNDDKILMREKIKSLKIENIFESVLANTNKDIEEFVKQEKLDIDPKKVNSILGVIYDNQIYFSSTGKNKAFLIYKKKKSYELLNIDQGRKDGKKIDFQKFFNTVISGEIPPESFFLFTNEALPEYISHEELKEIITVLPPFSASEQIKNKLLQINNYAPFSGIIIKNTSLSEETQEKKQKQMEPKRDAKTSLSGLKNTESKTENMLSPAGVIKTSGVTKKITNKVANLANKIKPKFSKNKEQRSKKQETKIPISNQEKNNSLLLKDKIFFKKKPSFGKSFKNLLHNIFNFKFNNIIKKNKKSKRTAIAFLIIIVLFAGSLIYTNYQNKLQQQREAFANQIEEIEQKQNQVDSYLLYRNDEAAKNLLAKIKINLNNLPQEKDYQTQAYNRLEKKFQKQLEEVRNLIVVSEEKVTREYELTSLNSNAVGTNLIYQNENLYITDNNTKNLYKLANKDKEVFNLNKNNLSLTALDEEENFYVYDNKSVIKINPEGEETNLDLSFNEEEPEITAIKTYAQNLYTLDNKNKSIYKFSYQTNNISTNGSKWLEETENLTGKEIIDLAIDGNIYILDNQGQIHKFYIGEKQEFSQDLVEPKITNAKEFLISENKIFILENDRILKFQFSGPNNTYAKFIEQYELPWLNGYIKNIAFDSENNKIYFLANTSLYSFLLEE